MQVNTQTSKLTTGSYINHLMTNNTSKPVVGQYATRTFYTDRRVYKVEEVSECGKRVTLRDLNTVSDKTKEGGMGHQNWVHEETENVTHIVYSHKAWRIVQYTTQFLPKYNKQLNHSSVRVIFSEEDRLKLFPPDGYGELQLIEGITHKVRQTEKISILFGVDSYYHDWEF